MTLSLAWGLDSSIEVDGVEYELNLDYSTVLRWYERFQDKEETMEFKVFSALAVIGQLKEEEIADLSADEVQAIFFGIIKKIFGENEPSKGKNTDLQGNVLEDDSEPEQKYYDLIEDADYIYASFRQDYGINLLEERGRMHWDEFNALLIGLTEKTKFKKVIEIRMMKIPDKATEEERKQIIAAKKAVALKSNREAIEFEAMDLLQKREWYRKQQERSGS